MSTQDKELKDKDLKGEDLSVAELEVVYDVLAAAIDQAGDKSELFLVKLALMNANAIASAQAFQQHVQAALADL